MPEITIALIVFAYGLCIGSFLNVCIFRIPESKSIVSPGSSCPKCNQSIRFYDNIPVFSYLFLKGKCRNCGTPISFRYPATEFLTGLFALFVYFKFGLTIETLLYFIYISALITISFIDFDHRIIPDIISLPGIIICFIFTFFIEDISYIDSIIGILTGGGSLLLVALTYRLFTGKDGMGGGDIKLLAMIGALIGWKGVLFTIFSASFMGTVIGILGMLGQKNMNMKLAIPFGPFLSAGSVLYIFYGPEMIQWYFGFIH